MSAVAGVAASQTGAVVADRSFDILSEPAVQITILAGGLFLLYSFWGAFKGVTAIPNLLGDIASDGADLVKGGIDSAKKYLDGPGQTAYVKNGKVCQVLYGQKGGKWYKSIYNDYLLGCIKTEDVLLTTKEVTEWLAFLASPAVFFSASQYNGNYMGINKEGSYPNWPSEYSRYLVDPGDVRSMKIGKEFELVAYRQTDFIDYLGIYNSDVSNIDTPFLSFKIGKKGSFKPPVTVDVYSQESFVGAKLSLAVGSYSDLRSFGGGELGINDADSCKVPKGLTVTFYSGASLGGAKVTVIGPTEVASFNTYYNMTGHIDSNDIDGAVVIESPAGSTPYKSWGSLSDDPSLIPPPPANTQPPPGTPADELAPEIPKITLWAYPNYQGVSATFYPGQNITNLSDAGQPLGRQDADSLKVDAGITVDLWPGIGYGGTKMTLVGPIDIPDLNGRPIGRNDVDSLMVYYTGTDGGKGYYESLFSTNNNLAFVYRDANNIDGLRKLIDYGLVDPNQRDLYGNTLLAGASARGLTAMVTMLRGKGAVVTDAERGWAGVQGGSRIATLTALNAPLNM